MKKIFFSIVFFGVFVFLFAPAVSSAQIIPCGGAAQDPCNFCHIFALANNIITFLLVPSVSINGGFPLIPIVAGLLIALGGFFIFISAVNPQNLQRGRTIIFSTVVGIFIVYGAYLFVSLILTALGVASWTGLGSWWQITCSFS